MLRVHGVSFMSTIGGALRDSKGAGRWRGTPRTTVDLAARDEVKLRLASADFPALFIAVDAASHDGQRGHKGLLRAEIALLLAAAIISVISDVNSSSEVAGHASLPLFFS
jgi:hypothetical protein